MKNQAAFVVTSCNFDFHQPIEAASFEAALAAAKGRGFEARIAHESTTDADGFRAVLVATWPPLYGTHIYNGRLAGVESLGCLDVA